ncbi:MAG: hypothetical protein ACI9J2_002056 [Saprospiraceae bacterium]|jgi:uncharacterized protein YjeT (DUF2065 family)
MDWKLFLAAFGLYLVFEGLMPLASPEAFKRFLAQVQAMPDQQLRMAGMVSIALGLFILYIA